MINQNFSSVKIYSAVHYLITFTITSFNFIDNNIILRYLVTYDLLLYIYCSFCEQAQLFINQYCKRRSQEKNRLSHFFKIVLDSVVKIVMICSPFSLWIEPVYSVSDVCFMVCFDTYTKIRSNQNIKIIDSAFYFSDPFYCVTFFRGPVWTRVPFMYALQMYENPTNSFLLFLPLFLLLLK